MRGPKNNLGGLLRVFRILHAAVLITVAATLALTTSMAPLSTPLVRAVFERSAFSAGATREVAPLIVCYLTGATAYLLRDVFVRVFYSLGDAKWPFLVSTGALVANAALDYVLSLKLGLGAPGLIAGTVIANAAAVGVLCATLDRRFRKVGGLGLAPLCQPLALLFLAGAVAAAVSWGSQAGFRALAAGALAPGPGRAGSLAPLIHLAGICGSWVASILAFFATCSMMPIPEVNEKAALIRGKIWGGLRKAARAP